MRLLDLTLHDAAENLALDEALLLEAEQSAESVECLRLWEPQRPLVVVGSSSRVAAEVDEAEAARLGAAILRRPSGGAAIVTGPGCLMYALILSYELRPALRSIEAAHCFVLDALVASLRAAAPGLERQGTSDLAIAGQKVSGNSVRCKRRWLLYHGTLLYNFPLDLIQRCLRAPPRTPAYRQGREHAAFCRNLPIDRGPLRDAVARAFQAAADSVDWPQALTAQLVRDKYAQPEWNLRC